ncbi:DUF4142 domain-containing protein [uncultured Nevskia sp.]|uniref:DUF4142 domain-containing protein n=1 Tax=uncultured Nevskia sp. TaxID=228950 RepID=UPI0025E7CFD1|nr:DUF4142 domain-containing protein [uncultured Nevskia sp.]
MTAPRAARLQQSAGSQPPKLRFQRVLMSVLVAAAISACASSKPPEEPDSVATARQVNEAKSTAVSEPAAKFLVEMVDARLMDYEEGELAARRGSTAAIRDYGRLMMRDQTRLLTRLELLALEAQVTVPAVISDDKRDGLNDLIDAEHDDFDKRFISSIHIDHKRDVGAFKKATGFRDAAIADFARQELPLIESHLAGIETIKKSY